MTTRSAAPRRDDAGRWCFVVDLGPGPDGSRRQARRRGFATKREAQEAMDRLRTSAREGTFVEPSKLTAAAYLDTWLEGLPTAGRRPATVANYRWVARSYLVPAIGGVRLQGLQPTQLDSLYASLGARGLSARTVRLTHSVIRKALADAVRKGLVIRNVATLADPPSAKSAQAPEMAWWTPAELASFLDGIANDELFALLRLVAMTGLRRGEACGLRWADVDLDAGHLRVCRQLGVVDGHPLASETPKSDAGRRSVSLDASTVTVLRRHRSTQAGRRLAIGSGWRDGDLVFCGPAGEVLHPDSVSKRFDRLVRASGLPRVRFHDLRHTHCAHLIAAGRNPREISKRLGHASVSFTLDRYGHLMPEADSQAAAAVAALVDGDLLAQ